jgi:GST-like protein
MTMIRLYYYPGPNPAKVALFLEEAELPYEVIPVDIRKGDQHRPDFVALNPNAKAPALIDGEAVIFDSNAILLYLADKTGRFLPPRGDAARGQLLSWLMFVATGIGPYSGQAVHFKTYAPEPLPYAVNRYAYETERHWRVVDGHLAKNSYLVGDTYTIADMALWGWARALPFIMGEKAWASLPNAKRLIDEIGARPAALRARELALRHQYKAEMDADAHAHMFPQNKRLAEA